jgi:heme-degrading monooxygenase HmoA
LRDQLDLSTWICIGAVVQGLLYLAIGRLSLTPAIALMLWRIFDAWAQATGLKHNTYMDGVMLQKTSAQFPDEEGNFGNKPANQDVVVFMIGTRYNHPYGLFAPHVKQIGDYFTEMIENLEKLPDDYGFLGASTYANTISSSKNELMIVCYFRNVEGLHAFAHSDYHMPAWNYWNQKVKEMPHITIFHETYRVPAGNWESIHVNSKISGLNATVFKVPEEGTGKEVYRRPIVDASKGLLKTSAGRMGRSDGLEHSRLNKLMVDPYDQ